MARTNDPAYLGYADEWLTAINAILARHQFTDGGGTVLLYQIENEYASYVTSATGIDYMAHLYAKVRADGITVPIFHNDKGRNGYWVPGSFSTDGGQGDYLYAFDGYPVAPAAPRRTGATSAPAGPRAAPRASPATPGIRGRVRRRLVRPVGRRPVRRARATHERGLRRDAAYERRFYLTNLANGIKLQNVYMTFGGTSWGWLPAPVVYTSYDYGAAISEARQLTAKIPADEADRATCCESVPDIAKLDQAGPVTASNSLLVRRITWPTRTPARSSTSCATTTRADLTVSPCRSARPAAPTPCRSPARCNWTART